MNIADLAYNADGLAYNADGLAYNVMILTSIDLKKFYMPIYIHSQVQYWKISKNFFFLDIQAWKKVQV